jgi:excisionase family DNA binding protein
MIDTAIPLDDLSRDQLLGVIIGASARLSALATVPVAGGSPGNGASLLTANEVAALLGIPKARVYEMQRRGQIGCVRDGRTVRFGRNHVDAFIAARSVAAKAG